MKKTLSIFLFYLLFLTAAEAQETLTDSLLLGRPQSTSPNDMLVGKISGVCVTTPNESGYSFSGGEVDIRGVNTIHGSNAPLYIIDGVEIGSDYSRSENPFWNYSGFVPASDNNPLFQLNSYDIKSITVLKDVSATSLYGSKGANGVVIINTTDSGTPKDGIGIRTNFGPAFNHHLVLNGSRGNSVYNFSLGYSGVKDHSIGSRQDLLNLKFNYRSHSGELLWYGVNVLGCYGSVHNPNAVLPDTDDDATRFAALASAYLRFNFTKWLKWTTTAGVDFRDQTRYFWYGDGNEIGASYKGLASVSGRLAASFNVKTEFEFNRYFAEKHHLTASLGAEYHAQSSRLNVNNGNDFISYELRAKGISLANSADQLHNYSNAWGHDDLYLTARYGFAKYFSLGGSIRFDNTPEYDGAGFIFYPAADVDIDLHEIFMPDLKALSTLSLEGGYGISGDEENVCSGYLTDFVTDTYYPISKDAEPYHDGLYRLRTAEFNVGLRIGFISDRIVLGAKYYNRDNEDTFKLYSLGALQNGVWNYTERSLLQTRTNRILNAGYELDFRADIFRTKTVEWSIDANACCNSNVITQLDSRDALCRVEATGSYNRANVLGYSVGSFLGYQVGQDGYYVDIVPDGKITEADRIVLAGCIPKWFGGLSTFFRVQNFSLDIVASWAVGYSALNSELMVKENRSFLTGRYLYPADYFILQKAAARYDIPLKSRKVVKDLYVEASYGNVIMNNLTSIGVGLKF